MEGILKPAEPLSPPPVPRTAGRLAPTCDDTPDVTVLVVNYNTAHLLAPMRQALRAAEGALAVQLVVVDNASRDASRAVLEREFAGDTVLVNRDNVGFGRANNQGLPFARGRYVLLLNTDAFVGADTLERTVAYMDAHPDCGVLGVRLEGRDGTPQAGCRRFPTPWNVFARRAGLPRALRGGGDEHDHGDPPQPSECDWVPGCYFLVRRQVIEDVGLFDPRYFLYGEEVDHCRAARRAGWKVVYYPHTRVVHLGGESARSVGELTASGQLSALQVESELLYFRKHHGLGGVIACVALTALLDAVLAAKHLLRRRPVRELPAFARHVALVGSLARRTRLGTRPTR